MNVKRKGSRAEGEVLQIFRENCLYAVRNDQRYISGHWNPDILLEVQGTEYHCEIKRVEQLNLGAALRQAERDTDGSGRVPVVIHRRNREQWIVSMNLEDFLRLTKERQRFPF